MIPDYQTIMAPLMQVIADGQTHSIADITEELARRFKLSPEESKSLLPSGQQPIFDNRVGWARTYLKKAGLLESPGRGLVRITNRGKEVLGENPKRIDLPFLMRFREFREFRLVRPDVEGKKAEPPNEPQGTPEEIFEDAYETLNGDLATRLLERIEKSSDKSFERLVVDLLVKMGYGGTFKDAAQAIGRSGDGGVDGVIKEDKLGFDVVYIQAKKWAKDHQVDRPTVQAFAGALEGHKARKGVFITLSSFSAPAREYVKQIEKRIVLIDRTALATMMMEHGVGVSTERVYEIKRLDDDYFMELSGE